MTVRGRLWLYAYSGFLFLAQSKLHDTVVSTIHSVSLCATTVPSPLFNYISTYISVYRGSPRHCAQLTPRPAGIRWTRDFTALCCSSGTMCQPKAPDRPLQGIWRLQGVLGWEVRSLPSLMTLYPDWVYFSSTQRLLACRPSRAT